MNYFSDTPEWQYLFRNALDWDTILPLYYSTFPTRDGLQNKEEVLEFYETLLGTTGKWAAENIAPRARELDQVGGGKLVNNSVELSEPLRKTYAEARELDLFGLTVSPEHEGMGVPISVGMLMLEQVSRACFSTVTQLAFHASIADMLERFCDEETQKKFIPGIMRGELSGSMCLTEPGSGSDVGSLRTTAEKQPDGTYHINGSKCFITNGGGGIGFVLARIKGAAPGLNGISMFLAEEWTEAGKDGQKSGEKHHNYKITKIEEKLGMHGSPTCEIVYENTVGRLVGEEGEGFKLMLHLMNEARISTALQCMGGMEASVGYAREYAMTRKQFGKPIAELPLFKRNLEDWETERDAFRALIVDTISHFDVFQRLDLKKRHTGELSKDETALHKKAWKKTRLRTPLVKYYGTEACALLSQRAIQALGGYGFMKEYDAERFHRDSIGALLYEGTSQIQALMAMKDFVNYMMKDPSKFLQSMVGSSLLSSLMGDSEFKRSYKSAEFEFRKNVAGLIIRCFKPEVRFTEQGLMETLGEINKVFKRDYWQEAGRFDRLMVHAETLCQALSYLETLKVLSHHARKDEARGPLYHSYLRLVVPRLAGIYADWKQ
jgi:alkylation response protein AidB-like acyl-CoA dehydrogenase